ncbi:flippase [Enterococcus faecium]|uniref:flippase n=1 Tax=Enterococcus faecium TaxID=1352 RepID=UPI0002A351D9|nr:flippase [Enterococcus faecium]ELB18976.1 hypothetical protein OIQ_03960 [Enterococcus faecium EnGen0025]MBO6335873.1 flippase [Enterococcus faecium]
MKNSIGKNYMYNLLYQLFMLIVPIAVTPYVSRTLGENASGQYSYMFSIVTYFALFAALGFDKYAQRLIARHQDDKMQQSIDFWEIIIARFLSVLFSAILYSVILSFEGFGEKYQIIAAIMLLNILAIGFDPIFIFQGNEDFSLVVLRNVIIKIIGFICIFIFVKSQSDLWKYTLIQSLIVVLSCVSLWFYIPKYLCKIKISRIKPFKHIPATFLLFLPTIAGSVYTTLDKTLIGIITKVDAENGNYEYAERLVKMALTIIISLGTVMVPRNTKIFATGNFEEGRKNILNSIKFVFFLGIPLTLGLMSIADNLIPWYLGSGYDKAVNLVKLLSLIIVIIGMSNVFGLQFLIPMGRDKKFTKAIVIGAIVNFSLNLIFIPRLASYGAAIATIIGESVVTLIMYFMVKDELKLNFPFKMIWKFLLAGIIMFTVCNTMSHYLMSSIINTVMIVGVGILVYFLMLLFLREQFFIRICNKLKNVLPCFKKK